jgi:RNA polymerase sigma-70 factor, ECF subfamily
MREGFESQSLLPQLPALRRYAMALTRDADQADDLVQDCMVRALSNARRFEAGTNLRGWLFTILHNIFCDRHRCRRREGHQLPLEDWEDHLTEPAGQGTVIDLREVALSFASLEPEQQMLLFMVGVEGESYEQAAQHFGTAVGTIKSRLNRARARLRLLQHGIGETTRLAA